MSHGWAVGHQYWIKSAKHGWDPGQCMTVTADKSGVFECQYGGKVTVRFFKIVEINHLFFVTRFVFSNVYAIVN